MIAGIGVDMASVSRIEAALSRQPVRLPERFLHPREQDEFKRHRFPARFLAKRFAVKEAAVKALGTGERDGVLLRDFYVEHDEQGKPLLRVSGEAGKRCAALGVTHMHVSLSDEVDSVVAFVVLEAIASAEE